MTNSTLEFAAKNNESFESFNRDYEEFGSNVDGLAEKVFESNKNQIKSTQNLQKQTKKSFDLSAQDIEKLQSEFKDIELKDLRKEEREDIERKYNVVYNLDKANRNTALIVKQEFYDNQIIPLLDIIKSIWNNHILKEIDKNLYLDYVDPTPKDTELLLQMLQQNPHMATKGRISEIMGIELEEWEDETEICIPSSMVRISLETGTIITDFCSKNILVFFNLTPP